MVQVPAGLTLSGSPIEAQHPVGALCPGPGAQLHQSPAANPQVTTRRNDQGQSVAEVRSDDQTKRLRLHYSTGPVRSGD